MSLNLLAQAGSITTIDQNIAEWFNSNFGNGGDWSYGNLILCFIALALTIILCSFIGFEREKRGRSAGLRTHLLVGVGSCIIMIVSIYGFPGDSSRDIARLAAQVVAGVGFLGAGAIIHNGSGIKGLTTASTIWLVMAIGLACGSMNFVLAILGTILVMVILTMFRKVERTVNRTNPVFVVLAKADVPLMSLLLNDTKESGLQISDVTSQIVQDGNEQCVEMTFKVSEENGKQIDPEKLLNKILSHSEIRSASTLNHH